MRINVFTYDLLLHPSRRCLVPFPELDVSHLPQLLCSDNSSFTFLLLQLNSRLFHFLLSRLADLLCFLVSHLFRFWEIQLCPRLMGNLWSFTEHKITFVHIQTRLIKALELIVLNATAHVALVRCSQRITSISRQKHIRSDIGRHHRSRDHRVLLVLPVLRHRFHLNRAARIFMR